MKKINYKQFLIENSALATLLILLIVGTAIMGTTFLSIPNFRNILLNNAIIGIIALGMTLVIISGGIDLSVGSATAAAGLFAIWTMNMTGSIVVGILGAMAVGALMGAFNGVLVAKFGIPAFIVTLGAMQIFRSLSLHFFRGGGILIAGEVNWFLNISNTRIFFDILPLPVIYWLVLAAIVGFIAKNTAFGRHVYAVGSSERAANLSAIKVDRVKVYVYMLCGLLVSLAAVVEASRLGSMNSASSGGFYELNAIAAVVIGGTAMSGGRGRIVGTVFGTLTLGVINNVMNLMGLPSFLVGAIQGSIVILAVLLQRSVEKKTKQF